jgi:hypothetical protein
MTGESRSQTTVPTVLQRSAGSHSSLQEPASQFRTPTALG